MDLIDYQIATRTTAIYGEAAENLANPSITPRANLERQLSLFYVATKLCGEAGEAAEHIGKMMRDDYGKQTAQRSDMLRKELGDVAWYWARLCDELGFNPEEILEENIKKLESRRDRNVIHGSGSDR